jgi:hypothetical protein
MSADLEQQDAPTVDLVSCNWGGTFQHPCFWILVGILGTMAFQYVMTRQKP